MLNIRFSPSAAWRSPTEASTRSKPLRSNPSSLGHRKRWARARYSFRSDRGHICPIRPRSIQWAALYCSDHRANAGGNALMSQNDPPHSFAPLHLAQLLHYRFEASRPVECTGSVSGAIWTGRCYGKPILTAMDSALARRGRCARSSEGQ